MKIKDELTTTEQFELDISMEELLKIIAEEIRLSGYYIYCEEPYLDTYEDCGKVSVELIADDIHTEDIFTRTFAEKLQQMLKDRANKKQTERNKNEK